MTIVGYARTSTADQRAGLDDQISTLLAAGCDPARIYREQVSSVDKDRPQLAAALAFVRDGDVFMVTKPDRLARSIRDLLRYVDMLKDRGVTLRILSMGVDTGNATSRLILNVLASVAEFEREIMLERQAAGIAAAKAAGKYAKTPSLSPEMVETARTMIASGSTMVGTASVLGVTRMTLWRALKRPPAACAPPQA